MREVSRRSFLLRSTAAAAWLTLESTGTAEERAKEKQRIPIGGFTKELQELSYDETAEAALEIGWDGIECAVRPGGHVLPERVEEDLPRMVEALTKRKLDLLVMATAIHHPKEAHTESVLRTASKLGVKYYRLGYWEYEDDRPIQGQLDEIKSQLSDLAALNRELGICGVFQNHSGGHSVGAPVWDIYELIHDLDPDSIGAHFDIGHATVEGGYAWRIHFRRMESRIRAAVVKDFKWKVAPGKRPRVAWCRLGEGMIDPDFFRMLKNSDFTGPVTTHFEYPVDGKSEKERVANLIQAMKKDCQQLKKWLAAV